MRYLTVLAAGACLAGTTALAAPINATGNVNPDVIFGSGNANGSFTGVSVNNIELALRGKVRYNLAGLPENTFNYDGASTYTFDPAQSNAPANRSAFNFEWSVNSDVSGNGGTNLIAYTYQLAIDYDPTAATSFTTFDPINQPAADHAIGTNSTGNGGGTSNPLGYSSLIANNNVAQNSWNLGFFNPVGFDPQTQGQYTIRLSAFGSNGATLGSTSIDIIYGDVPSPVPLPASLPLMLAGLAGVGFVTRRKRRAA
ncbi:VPLPA-CTERM sorting domain-containing protein [uncultured Roseobacter sp.]|uniref:VPLPA-CTERM sorting domain-containing protein n=1 Tax=uncultured Roseobacter sp. TaxID=114847 RepID=UPI00260B454A|nr:VPLPA-CTERM sorting domain-containing protein [uncultured Roseobacter sp.]